MKLKLLLIRLPVRRGTVIDWPLSGPPLSGIVVVAVGTGALRSMKVGRLRPALMMYEAETTVLRVNSCSKMRSAWWIVGFCMSGEKATMFGIGAVPPLASDAVLNACGKTTVFRLSCTCPSGTPVLLIAFEMTEFRSEE